MLKARYRIELSRDVPAAIQVLESLLASNGGPITDDHFAAIAAIGYEERYFRSRREQFSGVFRAELVDYIRLLCEASLADDSQDETARHHLIKCLRALMEDQQFIRWASSAQTLVPDRYIELELALSLLHGKA
jgi:hypothetical protein